MESDNYEENRPSYSGSIESYVENNIYSINNDNNGLILLNGVRNRRKVSDIPCCPVCLCTIRHNELHSHLLKEMDNLNKITMPHKRKSNNGTPNSSSSGSNGFSEDIDVTGAPGSEVFERVRRNRERRLRAVSRRAQTANTSTSASGSINYVTCPVCGKRISAATAERHVDSCLRNEERTVDVENDVDDSVDDGSTTGEVEEEGRGFGAWYSWGSEERVRAGALQLREGGALPHGAMLVRRASTDTTLVVDGDDDELMYGPPQYSPERIAPEQDDLITFNNSQDLPGYEEQAPAINEDETNNLQRNHTIPNNSKTSENSSSTQTVVSALKAKIRELEQRLEHRNNDVKCLICMGGYTEPVVSVQCWHVHCETCWLESLRAKKTCPQCNAITTASHLRRIYI